MPRLRRNWRNIGGRGAALLMLAGCSPAPADEAASFVAEKPALGLMTSLPLYWAEGAGIADLAAGRAAIPWQRRAIETHFTLVLLDTLSPIPAQSPDAPPSDPLAGIDRLAVIQPRGLSPADNVALDTWVRDGGRLLLVLDPALTGEYSSPLGDPRRPVDTALIPPVVARWGMAVQFDAAQDSKVVDASLAGSALPLVLAGKVTVTAPATADCTSLAGGAAARCRVGKGQVTLIADAALFEHRQLAGEGEVFLRRLLSESLP